MRATFILVFPSLITVLMAFTGVAHASATVLSGTQQEQVVTLIASPQPYVIRGDYYVPAGKQLVIEAAASFVAEKDASLSVSGTLLVNGMKEKPVEFRGKATGRSYWKGIKLQEGTGELNFVHISGAKTACFARDSRVTLRGCVLTKNSAGIDADRTAYVIEDCLISENERSGVYVASGPAEDRSSITSCTITGNGGWGLDTGWGTKLIVQHTIISGNREGGIRLTSGMVDGEITVGSSTIVNNGKRDVLNESEKDFGFSGNWWGDPATKLLISKGDTANLPNILDGHDEEGKGKVRVHDFLRERPKDCGAFASEAGKQGSGAGPATVGQGMSVTFSRDCYLIAKSEDYYPFHVALANGDTAEVQQYVSDGRVFQIGSGTKGLAVTAQGSAYGIRVLDGPNKGKQGWVYSKNVKTE